jgi:long-chain fatty acid transport protein
MRFRTVIALVATVALWLLGSRLLGDGLVRDGLGPISTGRGGTNLGFADNAAVILDNPAGMSNLSGNGLLEVGVDTILTDMTYRDPQNASIDSIRRAYPAGIFGFVKRLPDTPWTFGLGVFSPAGFGADYRMAAPPPFAPTNTLYRSLDLFGKLLPAVSYQVTDNLSIGGGVGVALNHAALVGPYFFQTGALQGAPTISSVHATGVGVCGNFGIQYRVTPDTMLGIAYTAPTHFVMDGNARATVLTPLGPLTTGFGDAKVNLTWPQSLGIGVKQNLCGCRRIGVDVIWYNWSSAFDQIGFTLMNPTNQIVGALAGNTIHDALPLRWHDTVSLRTGYEKDLNDVWTWRAGYVFHTSPVPSATLNPYTDGILLHTFCLGGTCRLRRGSINASYQYSFSPARHVADSDLVGGDFSNSSLTAQAHLVNLSYLLAF